MNELISIQQLDYINIIMYNKQYDTRAYRR